MKINHLILIITITTLSYGQWPEHFEYLSPGIKFGYTFGESNSVSYGFELSYVETGMYLREPRRGIVLSVDKMENGSRLYFGAEYMKGIYWGTEFGPSVIFKDGNIYWGATVTQFLPLITIPYYSYTYVFGLRDYFELGLSLKVPFKLTAGSETFPLSED